MEKQQTSNDYGISQELLTLSILSNYGTVSIPYGNSARYDCILECNHKFYRIQIKSLNMQDEDTIFIPMSNSRLSGNNGVVQKIYTTEDIDFIAVTFNNQVYLFSPEIASKTYTVRVNKPKLHNQHWIQDYLIDKVLDISIKSWVSLKEETREKNGSFKTRKFKCIDCGEPVWREGTRCVACERVIRSAKSAKPSREILKSKIKNTPFTRIAAEYGVTDNAVRKWCHSYNLPSKVSDIKQIISKGDWDSV